MGFLTPALYSGLLDESNATIETKKSFRYRRLQLALKALHIKASVQQVEPRAQALPRRFQAMMSTVVMLLVCLSSVVTEGLVDESSVAAMAKAMRDEMREELREEMREEMREQTSKQQQIVKLKDALEKKEEGARKAKSELTHVQLTTGGEVVELVSACPVPGFLFLAP